MVSRYADTYLLIRWQLCARCHQYGIDSIHARHLGMLYSTGSHALKYRHSMNLGLDSEGSKVQSSKLVKVTPFCLHHGSYFRPIDLASPAWKLIIISTQILFLSRIFFLWRSTDSAARQGKRWLPRSTQPLSSRGLYPWSTCSASPKWEYFIYTYIPSGLRIFLRVFYCGAHLSSQFDQETTAEQTVLQLVYF